MSRIGSIARLPAGRRAKWAVSGRFPPEAWRGAAGRPSLGARSLPRRTGLRPLRETDGPSCQVVSPRRFSSAARRALIV
jgi:hypothetical protein